MADAIFISYRRDDTEGEAGRLFDDLTRAFGTDAVFMDVAGIKPGVDFRKAIEDNVASCGVLLAIIGPTWASITGADGTRRLEDPNDFVALEIASALRREVPVIPVLVHEARMPAANLLPDSLKNFSYRNSVELSHARWNSDVQLLVEALKAYVQPVTSTTDRPGNEPVHATVPVQLPAPHPPSGTMELHAARSNAPLKAGVSFAVVVAIATAIFVAVHKPTHRVPPGFTGTWVEPVDRTGNGLNKLIIIGSGSALVMHAFGNCDANTCDWGSQPLAFDANQNAFATYAPSPVGSEIARSAKVTVHPVGNGLDVLVQNTYTLPAGRKDTQVHLAFKASP